MDYNMNIAGHLTIGAIGSLIVGNPLFLVGSILPDIALIPNEIYLLWSGKRFNKWNVKLKELYDISHSILILPLVYIISPHLILPYIIHLLVDIPFHTSNFRFNLIPFIRDDKKKRRRAILLSGGMDSIACLNIEYNEGDNIDLIFFDYNQEYRDLEIEHAYKAAEILGKHLIVIKKEKWIHDMPNRNYLMIDEVVKMGYEEVILGTRNFIPLFDKYGDSNWFNLKLYGLKSNIYINLPLIGLTKNMIKSKIEEPYTYFSSEGWNKNKKNINE
jgi:hypothetical protein